MDALIVVLDFLFRLEAKPPHAGILKKKWIALVGAEEKRNG